MPANKFTLKAVEAILTADVGVTALMRSNVAKLLGQDAPESCCEADAARILEISASTLYHWRKGDWDNAPHPFWFRCWNTLTGDARYDIAQLKTYAELYKLKGIAQRNKKVEITKEELDQYQKIKEQ